MLLRYGPQYGQLDKKCCQSVQSFVALSRVPYMLIGVGPAAPYMLIGVGPAAPYMLIGVGPAAPATYSDVQSKAAAAAAWRSRPTRGAVKGVRAWQG
jgi:hypothetical protein